MNKKSVQSIDADKEKESVKNGNTTENYDKLHIKLIRTAKTTTTQKAMRIYFTFLSPIKQQQNETNQKKILEQIKYRKILHRFKNYSLFCSVVGWMDSCIFFCCFCRILGKFMLYI